MKTIRNGGTNHGDKKLKRYKFSATVWAEGKSYVSKCPELGVVSFGSSPERALVKLEEAVELYLENARLLGLMPNLAPMLKSKHRFTTMMEVTI